MFIAIVELFANPAVAAAFVRGPDPARAACLHSAAGYLVIWVGIAVSARTSDPRTAGQLAILASLPTVAVTTLVAFDVIPRTHAVAVGCAAALLVLIRIGGRVASAMFDRERLITSTK